MKVLVDCSEHGFLKQGFAEYTHDAVRVLRDLQATVLVHDRNGVNQSIIANCQILNIPVIRYRTGFPITFTYGEMVYVDGELADLEQRMIDDADRVLLAWDGCSTQTFWIYARAGLSGKPLIFRDFSLKKWVVNNDG